VWELPSLAHEIMPWIHQNDVIDTDDTFRRKYRI